MKHLYLISTFRHAWNREFNRRLAPLLEAQGLVCYFAHRDTNQAGTRPEIFAQDMAGLRGCRTALAVAANESPNWGAEIGYAYGMGMPVIALAQKDHEIPLITEGMMAECVRVPDLDDIESYIESLAAAVQAWAAQPGKICRSA